MINETKVIDVIPRDKLFYFDKGKYAYHITKNKYLQSILKHGLNPKVSNDVVSNQDLSSNKMLNLKAYRSRNAIYVTTSKSACINVLQYMVGGSISPGELYAKLKTWHRVHQLDKMLSNDGMRLMNIDEMHRFSVFCKFSYVKFADINGVIVSGKKRGFTSNAIFIPMDGDDLFIPINPTKEFVGDKIITAFTFRKDHLKGLTQETTVSSGYVRACKK